MIFDKIVDIVAKELNVDKSKITMDTHIIDDLGADSLDAVELIMAIEDTFNIEIDDESAQKAKRISDLVNYVTEKTK